MINTKHEIPAFAGAASRRQAKFETKMLNSKLETLNSKQTQVLQTQNSKPRNCLLNFRFWIVWDLEFSVWNLTNLGLVRNGRFARYSDFEF